VPYSGPLIRRWTRTSRGDRMAAYIVLDDGRVLWRSNLAMDGLLCLIAEQLPAEYHDLQKWLLDKGSRPAPFIDFDIRGLSPAHRSAFYAAARRALEDLSRKDVRIVEKGRSAEALERLLQMKQSMDKGEPPLSLSDDSKLHPFDGQPINLSELWELEATDGSGGPDSRERKSHGPGRSVVARLGLLVLPSVGITVGVIASWYFGQADVSRLELSCVVGVAVALTWGVTALVLLLWRRAEQSTTVDRPRDRWCDKS